MSFESMFKTWAKGYSAAPTAGGEGSSFVSQGTISIPDKNDPVYLYGILTACVLQIVTAGESLHPICEVNSEEMGIQNLQRNLPEFGMTDPIATNTQFVAVSSKFLPIFSRDKANGKDIDFALKSSQASTGKWVSYSSAIFGNRPPDNLPEDYKWELMFGFESLVRCLGKTGADAAKAHATADADVPLTGISIPANAGELVGLMGLNYPNAPTASEESLSEFTFESGSVQDFAPQEYPSILNFHPTLGTVVGGAVGFGPKARQYPVRFPLPSKGFTLEVKDKMVLAQSNAPDVTYGALYRPY